MKWYIPATIRSVVTVVVEADTRSEAIRKFRERDWIESNDAGAPDDYTVTKIGPATQEHEPQP